MLQVINNNCDGQYSGNCTGRNSQVRKLPFSNGNLIICFTHYLHEINFRKESNKDLETSAKYDLPKWEDLEVYTGE